MNKLKHIFNRLTPTYFVGVITITLLSACFTGIEGTQKIQISKNDEKEFNPTPEDIFIAQIQPSPITLWQHGKKFFVTEDHAAIIFDANPYFQNKKLGGKTISFSSISTRKALDGKDLLILTFLDDENTHLHYNTTKSPSDTIMSDQIPMLIDCEMIQNLKTALLGKQLWTKSPIWYDKFNNTIKGKKYVPVNIIDVMPGDKVFPAKIIFTHNQNDTAAMLMNIGKFGINSRNFGNIFSLTDIRLKYPKIEDNVWELIQNGQIQNGMTKQECSLSIGLPDEITQGHDYSKTLELWQYSDGTFLQFENSILVNFRK